MSDNYGDVRRSAAEALGLIGDERAIPALGAHLNDDGVGVAGGKRVGEVVREALKRIGTPAALEALTRIGKAEKLSVSPMPDLYQVLTSTDESAILKAINSIILKENTPTERVKDLLKLIAETPPELSRSEAVRLAAQRAMAVLNTTK
jgi:hypothetical protein